MIEFSGALSRLNEIKEWRQHLDGQPSAHSKPWKEAIAYFNANHKRLKDIRDDLGGHFQESAAEFAITHFQPDATGNLKIRRFKDRQTASVMFGFAHEIVAVALHRTMKKDTPTIEEIGVFVGELFALVTAGWKHAVSAVNVVVTHYFIPQFWL